MENRFTERAEKVLRLAQEIAGELGHGHVGTEHLLYGLLREGEGIAAKTLAACGLNLEKLRQLLTEQIGRGTPMGTVPQGLTVRAGKVIEQSVAEAQRLGQCSVGTEHLLLGILRESDCQAQKLLSASGVEVQRVFDMVFRLMGSPASGTADSFSPTGSSGGGFRGKGETRTLNQFGFDLTQSAREGKLDPVIGRERETERAIAILSRRRKNNPCLIGEPGVGKTAVAEGLALRLAAGTVPEALRGKRLVSLDMAGMVAGTKYRGEFEERIRTILEEARRAGNVILFIDELHSVMGAGSAEGAVDAANILKPQLARGELRVVGATTIAEYRRYIERDAALERRFQPVLLEEPTPAQTLEILQGLRGRYELFHGLHIQEEALDAAVRLSVRYLPDRRLPDKAIDLIDEAAACRRIKLLPSIFPLNGTSENDVVSAPSVPDPEKHFTAEVTAEDVAKTCAAWARLPLERLTQEDGERLRHLEERLRSRIIGQDEALTYLARAVRRARVGLSDPARPSGSFLFSGPTGVGKTETARVLAEELFGDEHALIRLDMSEYSEAHAVSRLIGAPPGYVGHEEGGQLTDRVRSRPYSVVLFDELEKAHPDVYQLLLQILEDGHLTDSRGRQADFRNTIILITSNLGTNAASGGVSLGFSENPTQTASERRQELLSRELKTVFRPEFLNRLDAVVPFAPLGREALGLITRKLLGMTAARFAGEGYRLEWDEETERAFAEDAEKVHAGARPLRRMIAEKVEDRAAEAVLEGVLVKGGVLKLEGTKLRFESPVA